MDFVKAIEPLCQSIQSEACNVFTQADYDTVTKRFNSLKDDVKRIADVAQRLESDKFPDYDDGSLTLAYSIVASSAEHAETITSTMAALSMSELLEALNAGLTSAGEESTINSIDSMEPPVQGTETVPVSVSSTTAPITHVVTGSMGLAVSYQFSDAASFASDVDVATTLAQAIAGLLADVDAAAVSVVPQGSDTAATYAVPDTVPVNLEMGKGEAAVLVDAPLIEELNSCCDKNVSTPFNFQLDVLTQTVTDSFQKILTGTNEGLKVLRDRKKQPDKMADIRGLSAKLSDPQNAYKREQAQWCKERVERTIEVLQEDMSKIAKYGAEVPYIGEVSKKMDEVDKAFQNNREQVRLELVSFQAQLRAASENLEAKQACFNAHMDANQTEFKEMRKTVASKRANAKDQARRSIDMIINGINGWVSAFSEHKQAIEMDQDLDTREKEWDEHTQVASRSFERKRKTLTNREEILNSEMETLEVLKDWMPKACKSVKCRLETSVNEARDEVPRAAVLIKSLLSVALEDQKRLDELYLKLAILSDEKKVNTHLELLACANSHSGPEKETVECADLTQLKKMFKDVSERNTGLHDNFDSNAEAGFKLKAIQTEFTENFSGVHKPLDDYDPEATFQVKVSDGFKEFPIREIYYTTPPPNPSDPWALNEAETRPWALEWSQDEVERRTRAIKDKSEQIRTLQR